MTNKPSFGNAHSDVEWGCIYTEIASDANPKIHLCHVDISDLKKLALKLSDSVMNSSWIMNMDEGARRSYIQTVSDTAHSLVELFNATVQNDKVSSEFGELMVSMGSSRSLNFIFQHISLPISELWKPQERQNEGFDFHTVCAADIINFGEAKYVSPPATSSATAAANQANDFFTEEKHYRDRVHLINLVSKKAISNLDNEHYGMVAAFSMNARHPLNVYKNAITTVESLSNFNEIDNVYIVGVSRAS